MTFIGDGRWCVIEGDCTKTLPKRPDQSVDHVICDPPYSEHVHSKSRGYAAKTGKGHGCVREREFGFKHLSHGLRRAACKEIRRICRRWVLVFCDLESVHLWRRGFEGVGLEPVRTGIWVKEGCAPQFTGDRPAVAAEAIVIGHAPGKKRWNSGGKRGLWSHPILGGGAHNSGPNRKSERVHTAQKPLPLMLELIEDFTDPDDLILDPFCGSGTTLVAAIRLGRRSIGIEMNHEFASVAAERCRAEERGLSLSAARSGQEPLFP